MTKSHWLYVLRTEDDKYYVGKTKQSDPQTRINQHMNGFYTAQWLKIHKPIETVEVRKIGIMSDNEAGEEENHLTLIYMKKYGYQNVRGGDFNYSGKYMKIGDRYFQDEKFKMLLGILFMIFVILYLGTKNT